MEKPRVLFISQEIQPFLPETQISKTVRNLPPAIQENGKEIRVFMPRYGCINERRHQLHEVIRLSGMNLIINDTDHPLIIKVASVPAAKMQVYFIDNEEYFKRKAVHESEDGKFFEDNDERAIFFSRGVLETVKKLGWSPDVIHCHGWMTAFTPIYIRKMYHEDPHFAEAKLVYSIYDNVFTGKLDEKLKEKLMFDGFKEDELNDMSEPTLNSLHKLSIDYSDAIIFGGENINDEVKAYALASGKPILEYPGEFTNAEAYSDFYDQVIEEETILAE